MKIKLKKKTIVIHGSKPKIPFFFGIKKKNLGKNRVVTIGMFFYNIEIKWALKHKTITHSSRDMRELMDMNIPCTTEDFKNRLGEINKKSK